MNEADYSGSADKVAPEPVSRRSFLGVLLGFGTVVMGAALSVPLIRFALHPLLTKTTDIGWSDVGKIDEFASLTAPLKKLITVEQRDGWRKIVSEKAIYVLPMKDGVLRVLSPICPHLGCSIPWVDAKHQFICPCHTAIFSPRWRACFRSCSTTNGRSRKQDRQRHVKSALPIFPSAHSDKGSSRVKGMRHGWHAKA